MGSNGNRMKWQVKHQFLRIVCWQRGICCARCINRKRGTDSQYVPFERLTYPRAPMRRLAGRRETSARTRRPLIFILTFEKFSSSMPGSSSLSAAARLHVVKANPGPSNVIDIESHPQTQEGGGGNARSRAMGKGKGKAKAKGNHVRDGPPTTPELAGSRHGTDLWDDLRLAWAGYRSQSKKGGQGTQKAHHHQPEGQASGSGYGGQGRRGHGGGRQAHAGQKRKATATNGTADDGGEHAAKRHKRGPARGAGRDAGEGDGDGAAQRHPDFWHPDGSVIVEVGKTKFKLHQSTLQKNSTYFADAFREREGGPRGDVRGPKGNNNLPVHHVRETTAEDFASLLTVIEEPMCVSLSLRVLSRCQRHVPSTGFRLLFWIVWNC